MKNKIFYTVLILLLTANAGFSLPLAVRDTVIKFSYAMAGVVLSSVLIFVILFLYNKIRSQLFGDITSDEEVLKTPKTKEEAIKFYIQKNRLR